MAKNKAEIVWTSDDSQVTRTLQSVENGMQAIARRMQQVESQSKKTTGAVSGGLDQAATRAVAFAGSMVGVGSAAAGVLAVATALKNEYDALVQRQRATAKSQAGAGEALREVRKVFAPDASMNAAQMEDRLLDIASKRGSNIATVAAAASTAFSAKGDLTNQQAASAIDAAVRMAPTNAGEASTLSGRYQDVMKASGVKDARAVAGWLTRVQQSSRIATMAGVGQNAVPAVNALVASGDTPEQAAEVFSALNQLMADQEGSLSRTAAINLGVQLKKLLPDVAGGTQGRIAALQADPKLRGKTMGKMSFDSSSGEFVKALLSGDAAAVAAYGAAQRAVPALDASQAAEFERQIAFIDSSRFAPIAEAARGGAAGAEARALRDRESGLRGQIRSELERTLTETREGFFYEAAGSDWLTLRRHDIRTGALGVDPAQQAINEITRIIGEGSLSAPDGAFAERQVHLLEDLGRKLDDIASTNRSMANEADRPQVRVPAAAAIDRNPIRAFGR